MIALQISAINSLDVFSNTWDYVEKQLDELQDELGDDLYRILSSVDNCQNSQEINKRNEYIGWINFQRELRTVDLNQWDDESDDDYID